MNAEGGRKISRRVMQPKGVTSRLNPASEKEEKIVNSRVSHIIGAQRMPYCYGGAATLFGNKTLCKEKRRAEEWENFYGNHYAKTGHILQSLPKEEIAYENQSLYCECRRNNRRIGESPAQSENQENFRDRNHGFPGDGGKPSAHPEKVYGWCARHG